MVTTPVRLGIAGTHGTGTTTLARRIEMELRAGGLIVARVSGLATRAAALGFAKMTRHTPASTEWIITSEAAAALEAERGADVVICGRTAYTALAYYLAAAEHRGQQPDPDVLDRLTALADLHTSRQALIMATVLDPAVPHAVPAGKDPDYADPEFRAAVDRHLHQLLADRRPDYLPVTHAEHAAAVQTAVAAATDRPAS
ncbi:hypothetical protein GCM10010156_66320 [Planobispora rosea]|uniref:NadR/Ttd14 AAA domain-containing protein n=1 Tax=Planobispora rosea TaxID=35762 RepID=A0A8J3S8K1_PLARO|nr:AAA family ATPase [Planobispora rosea]GGS98932.1 hypothetical protein GCM10010156_66320 [Planobispora rosea]GIH87996.1 hypothetical protein Pro02_64040 [Planobispora rosea]